MSTYLFVTDPESSKLSSVKDRTDNEWSCSKSTTVGDTALVYFTGGPGISCEWRVTRQAEPHQEWRYACEVTHVRDFDPPISLKEIWSAIQKSLWPAAYTHFRGLRSIRIPDAVVDKLLSLRPRFKLSMIQKHDI